MSLVLGVENVGKFNYSASIISYFSLIAIFGISTYAVREGARLRDHRDSIQKFSNQVLTINCITTLIAYLLLVLLLWFSHGLRSYVGIILLQSASILFTTIGIEWVNTVFEDYLYTTVRWLVLQVLSIVLMLVFVREQEHLYRYVLISLLPVVGANISNLFYCRRYVKFRLTRNLELKKHLPPLFVLFIANITNIIFVNSGQTMLGAICGNFSSGIYGTAAKVYTMIKVVFTSVLVVFMPRISNLFVKTDAKQMKKVVTDIFNMFLLLLMPLAT